MLARSLDHSPLHICPFYLCPFTFSFATDARCFKSPIPCPFKSLPDAPHIPPAIDCLRLIPDAFDASIPATPAATRISAMPPYRHPASLLPLRQPRGVRWLCHRPLCAKLCFACLSLPPATCTLSFAITKSPNHEITRFSIFLYPQGENEP